MTADIELLPLPEGVDVIFSPDGNGAALDVFIAEQVQDYARANVAHATAAKDAEIEALRAEVGCLQQQYDERTAYMIVHRGAALACSDAVRSAYSDEHHRAERLAEALRPFANLDLRPDGFDKRPDDQTIYARDQTAITVGHVRRAQAALRGHDQEGKDG